MRCCVWLYLARAAFGCAILAAVTVSGSAEPSKLAHDARGFLIQRKLRDAMRGDPKDLEKIIDEVKKHLAGAPLQESDLGLLYTTARLAEASGNEKLAVDTYKTFAKMLADSKDPAVQRLLGASEDTGKLLGLDKDWAYRAIKAVGNYGEIFERNVGPKSALKLPRGANNLWNKGGLMYAPPIR